MTDVRTATPEASRSRRLHVGVAAASWNSSVTDRLLEGALARLEELGVGTVTVVRVPGSLELPVAAQRLARIGCDAVVAVGTIVKGDTDHYTIVSTESAHGLTLVSHHEQIPVANGVLAVHDISHAVERSRPGATNKGAEAATAAVEAALALAALSELPPT